MPTRAAVDDSIHKIQHIIIIMQENRSFDHYFGSLRGVRGFADPNALVFTNGQTVFYQPQGLNTILPFHITNQCLTDVPHYWGDLHVAANNGKWDQWIPLQGTTAMVYYDRTDLGYYYSLAEAYTICDAYFCSTLASTYPNRLYLMTGMIDPSGSGGGPVLDNSVPTNGFYWTTYPERLQAAGITWKVYQQAADYYDLNQKRWQTSELMPAPVAGERPIGLLGGWWHEDPGWVRSYNARHHPTPLRDGRAASQRIPSSSSEASQTPPASPDLEVINKNKVNVISVVSPSFKVEGKRIAAIRVAMCRPTSHAPPCRTGAAARSGRRPGPAASALDPDGREVEPVVEPFQELGQPLPLAVHMDRGVVPARRQHRIEGEGDKERHQDGEGDADAELEEEPADDAAHEGDRDEDGDD